MKRDLQAVWEGFLEALPITLQMFATGAVAWLLFQFVQYLERTP